MSAPLPPERSLGGPAHIQDHNLIVDACLEIKDQAGGDAPPLPDPHSLGQTGHTDDHNKIVTFLKWIQDGGGGKAGYAVVDSSTASDVKDVLDPDGDMAKVYTFTGTGTIRFLKPGLVDVLVQGGGGNGNVMDGTGGAGGAGGQIERRAVYVTEGTDLKVLVGAGCPGSLDTSNQVGTSSFQGITAVGGAPASQYRDRTPGGGACGGSHCNGGPGAPSSGMYGQGRIGAEMRGGNAGDEGNGPGGGVNGDRGEAYTPGADWGAPGPLGGGGNAGNAQAANTGNGGNAGATGNSGIVFIRVKGK